MARHHSRHSRRHVRHDSALDNENANAGEEEEVEEGEDEEESAIQELPFHIIDATQLRTSRTSAMFIDMTSFKH